MSPPVLASFGPVPRAGARKALMRELALEVAHRHGLTLADLQGPERRRGISWPRHEAMYEITHGTSHSSTAIGRFFNRDHSTVLHAVKRHRARLYPEGLD